MKPKYWTSILVCLMAEGIDPSIFPRRSEAHKKIKAALNSLPTFTDISHQIASKPDRPHRLFVLGSVEYLMKMEEVKELCYSVTDFPPHLLHFLVV